MVYNEDSTVWVNGIKVGGWAYGYSGFFLDITPIHKCGQECYCS